jgi:hypothetical protein
MAAAAVRPIVTPETLLRASPLKQQMTSGVEQKYGEGTVEDSIVIVTRLLVSIPDHLVTCIHEYQLVLIATDGVHRLSAHLECPVHG